METGKRDDLAGEHKMADIGQAALAGLFVIVYIADNFFLKYTVFLNNRLSLWFRVPLGLLLLLATGVLSKSGHRIIFKEKREVPQVVRSGVFSVVRHPIYLGEILLYLGLLIFGISLAAAVVWVIIIFFLYFLARHEERLLLDRFGDEYRTYMQKIPMFIPAIRVKAKHQKGTG